MATSNPYATGTSRFKINVNRVKSKKWKDADKVDYEGGWGDGDSDDGYDEEPAPVSADNPRHPAWNAPPNIYQSNRSVTNPSPSRAGQRPSFDRGDDRRHVSSAAGFDSAYPTTQRSPFPDPQHEYEPPMPNYGMQPPLRLNTQGQGPGPGPMPPGNFRPGSRGRQYPPFEDVPFSAPGSFPQQRRSGSSNRPPPGDVYSHSEGPIRPESRSSTASHRQFPPRKASLSQAPPADYTQGSQSPALSQSSAAPAPPPTSSTDDRPPPVFIRPSDIYKRMNEEMEKVRKSQESSRPSIDSEPNRTREGSVGARSTPSDSKEPPSSVPVPTEDLDSTRRLKPTLDPVPERKSEYGFDNLLKTQSGDNAPLEVPQTENESSGVARHDTTSSSVYTDRPDPVSAASLSRNASLTNDFPETEPVPAIKPSFGLPQIGRLSGFGLDMGLTEDPTPEAQASHSEPSRDEPPSNDDQEPNANALRHQPTMGYTSVVHQAFDQSQNQTPFSPVSTSDTIDRSNSASTTDISPIIHRKPDQPPFTPAAQPVPPTIAEEHSQRDARPESTSTLKAGEVHSPQGSDFSPPAPIRAGYRRDVTPPSRDNSPAKRPLEVGLQRIPRPQYGSVVDELDEYPSSMEAARGRGIEDKPLPAEPKLDMGAPNIPSPAGIPRSESPPKGTVRDLAGKLESSSGRSSPTNSSTQVPLPGLAQVRPAPQTRFDSFRPAIPGGWQSFTSSAGPNTPGTSTPSHEALSAPHPRFAQTRAESTESIPTAHAPTSMMREDQGITQQAFAAAASAGSALAGALAGHRVYERDSDSQKPSGEESENEWDRSSSSSDENVHPETSEETPKGVRHLEAPAVAASGPSADAPLVQPTSLEASTPLSTAASGGSDVPRSNLDDFPAPLRMSRSIDPSSLRPTVPDVSISQETSPERDNERLQQEIVKSLTPKSSNLEDEAAEQGRQPEATHEASAYRAVSASGTDPAIASTAHFTPHEQTRDESHTMSSPHPTPGAGTSYSNDDPTETGLSEAASGDVDGSRSYDQDPPTHQQPSSVSSQLPITEPRLDTVLAGAEHPPTSTDQDTSVSGRPFLQKRFSWETGSSPPASVSTPKPTSPPSTNSPDTIKASIQPPPTSIESASAGTEVGQPIVRQPTQPEAALSRQPTQPTDFPRESATTRIPQGARPPSGEPPAFRAILNLSTTAERIKAFDESRQFYATSNEELQGWLMSMNTPENSDLFANNGHLSLDNSENTNAYKPSPRRILTESAGARQMQEDGKKLMAAAGRFGGKAGHAAKGLFAKGKEKMRNASSGEKGILSSRRKSTGPLPDDVEDVPSRSQRNSTFLEGPPQIPFSITPASPLASPTDWFSDRELTGSQTSGLDQILQQSATAPSAAPISQETSKSAPEPATEESRAGDKPAGVPAIAHSPAISALDSEQEHHDNENLPSRSISQLTRPTDKSPIELSQGTTDEGNVSQEERDNAVEHEEGPADTLVPPKPFTDHPNGSTSDVDSSDRSLQVPTGRRRSVISDVSSASPSPVHDDEGRLARRSVSLSPADDLPVNTFSSPIERPRAQVEEPVHSSIVAQTSQRPTAADDSYAAPKQIETTGASQQLSQNPGPNVESGRERQALGHHRPFSFAGIEGDSAAYQPDSNQDQDLIRTPSQPLSPVSQARSSAALSKEMSQVSADEAPDTRNPPPPRVSVSYSRPFGVDPNARNSTAVGSAEPEEPPMDRAKMYSSESPLPSARRAQEEIDRSRQPREQYQSTTMHQHQPSEEGYRIPGPYVQEYRSPKQISGPKNGRSQVQVQASGTPLPSARRSQQFSGHTSPQPQPGRTSYIATGQADLPSYQDEAHYMDAPDAYADLDMKPADFEIHSPDQSLRQNRQSMGPPPVPEQQQAITQTAHTEAPAPAPPAERKRSTFGKLFGVGSKGSKLQKQGRVGSPVENPEPVHKEKRGSMLRRAESVSSHQSSRHGGQDHLGHLPPSNLQSHSARRLSRDNLRAPTPEVVAQPTEGKKKRFSGLGGKLFKSSSAAKAATIPAPSTHSNVSQQQNPTQRVLSPGPHSARSPRVMSPEPYSAHTPYDQYAEGPGSYFYQGHGGSGQPPAHSGYAPDQYHAQTAQYPTSTSAYQHIPRPNSQIYPPQTPPQGAQPPAGQYPLPGAYPYLVPSQNRPSDLRIDTSNPPRGHYSVPASAPVQNRAVASASAPYNPHPSPRIPTTTAPASASPRANQDPRAHVIDLHKRSRSPRLGRPASDEFDVAGQLPSKKQAPGVNSMLGTFSSKRISPVGGVPRPDNDQERPYAITVPGLDDDGRERRRKQTPAQRIAGEVDRSDTPVSFASSHGGHPHGTSHNLDAGDGGLDRQVSVLEGYNNTAMSPREARRSSARDKTTPAGVIAELPGSKAEGYESEEEIPMSATAYPGQEWMPVFVGDGRWDD